MRSGKPFLAAAAMALGLLTGCVSHQVDDHSYQFNEATGSLGMRLLLLNAVRASKDYPLQFSKISAYQGTGTTSASVSATLPLRIPGNGSMTPRVDWKDGISQLSLVDLNTAEAQQALKKTISYKSYIYYTNHNGRRSFIAPFMLMVEHYGMTKALYSLIKDSVEESCQQYLRDGAERLKLPRFTQNRFSCSALESLERGSCNIYNNLLETPSGAVVLRNDLTTECKYKAFIAGSLQLSIIGATPVLAPESKKPGPTSTQRAAGNTFNIYVADSKGGEQKNGNNETIFLFVFDKIFVENCKRASLCTRKAGHYILKEKQVEFLFRSPERMVRYLGDLVSAQSYGPERFVPRAFDPERQEVFTLLTVKRGTPPAGDAAVSIRDPDGEIFYIPRQNLDLPKRDLSLETL
ncbi:MAG: hypothetical protein WAN86_01925, partial [Hyphomicrobiaceae bacterium]